MGCVALSGIINLPDVPNASTGLKMLPPWRQMLRVPPKRGFLNTKLHGAKSHTTAVTGVTATGPPPTTTTTSCPHRPSGPPILHATSLQYTSPRIKRSVRDADHSAQSNAKVKNV
jgi:hypothetical protein